MNEKKDKLSWEFLTAGFLLGGFIIWLLARLNIYTQASKTTTARPKESPMPPPANPMDYETWLDWLVNSRPIEAHTLPVPDVSAYRTWLDPIFKKSRAHWIPTAIYLSFIAFLFGLALAVFLGFFPLFIRTPAIYLAFIGTAMGLGMLYWVGRAFPPAFAALAPYFGVAPETFSEFLNHWLSKMYNRRAMLGISAGVVLASFIAMAAVFLYPDVTYKFLQQYAPSLVMLDPEWYFGGANFAKMLIIDLYFLINFTLVISAAWLCIYALVILYELAKLPILPIPSVLTFKLKKIVDIFLAVCLVWLVAAAIFVLLFVQSLDILSLVWIGSQMVLTLFTFLLPQFLSRRVILNLREELIVATRLAYDRYFTRVNPSYMDPQKRLKLLNELSAEASAIKAWPTEPFDWMLMIAGQALPPATAFIRQWFESHPL